MTLFLRSILRISEPISRTAIFSDPKPPKSLRRRVLLILLALILAILLINVAVNQFVRVERVTVPIRKMDAAFEGYTLLHISDLKGLLFGKDQQFIRFALRDAQFDAVVMTGDMVSSRGNAQPLYELIEVLRELNPDASIYMIPGDRDPLPASMSYATGGSPFAPWILGAQQRGARLLNSPQLIERDGHALWLTTSALLSLDLDTMQEQFERQYLDVLDSQDENEIDLAKYNLQWLSETRAAREAMTEDDVYISLTHVPPSEDELQNAYTGTLSERLHLVLCGHYEGGLIRLPFVGALFIPSQKSARTMAFCPVRRPTAGCPRSERPISMSAPDWATTTDFIPRLSSGSSTRQRFR